MSIEIIRGDALAVLRTMPNDYFHCVVTSPPYFGLRMYLKDGEPGKEHEIGLEATHEEWCARLVEVFCEVRRALRQDGVCFVNIGDSYAQTTTRNRAGVGDGGERRERWCDNERSTAVNGLKPKDLVGQPWMLALALRADGWWLRSEIIWAKPNPMPESVRDRPTKSHEQVFLLTKSPRYFWDAEAVREPGGLTGHRDNAAGSDIPGNKRDGQPNGEMFDHAWSLNPAGRNLRSVWTIATDPLPSVIVDGEKLDHFASFPIELARRCILAGTSAKGCCPECGAPWAKVVEREVIPVRPNFDGKRGLLPKSNGRDPADNNQSDRCGNLATETTGWRPTCSHNANPVPTRILDPFGGSGRTALAADELGRDCTLIELSEKSCAMARAQIERAKARRMIGDAARMPVPEGQMRLF